MKNNPIETQTSQSGSSSNDAKSAIDPRPASQVAGRLVHLSNSPRIFLMENFLSEEDCDGIVALARDRLEPSVVFGPNGEHVVDPIRTSSSAWLASDLSPIIQQLEQRIAEITKIPVQNGEVLSALRYAIGEKYGRHCDFYQPDVQANAETLAKSGQRIATAIVYLSNVEEGGDTIFPRKGVSIKPRKGSLLCFTNVHPDGRLDMNSLHAGEPVRKGEKWIVTKWLRERSVA